MFKNKFLVKSGLAALVFGFVYADSVSVSPSYTKLANTSSLSVSVGVTLTNQSSASVTNITNINAVGCSASASDNVITVTGTSDSGTCTVDYTANYDSSSSLTGVISYTNTPAISVTPATGPYYYGDTSQLSASGGDNSSFTYAVTSGSCSVSPTGLVTFPNATASSPASDSCSVNATQFSTNATAGSTFNYSLRPNDLEISVDASSLAYNDSSNVSVIGGNGGSISWNVDGTCTVSSTSSSGATLTANAGFGSCTVTAVQDFNNNTSASGTVSSNSVDLTQNLSNTPITISLDSSALVSGDLVYNTQARINYTVAGASGVTYDPPTVTSGDCEIVTGGFFGNVYYLKANSGSGVCTINMTASSANYTYSGSYNVNLLLANAPAIVVSPSNPSALAYNDNMNIIVAGGNDSNYIYSSSSNCSLSNTVTTNGSGSVTATALSGSGICTVVVSQNATNKYNAANTNYVLSLTPALSAASLSSTTSDLTYGDSATVTLTSNNTSAVTFSTTPGCQAVPNGNSATISVANASLGSCTVTATQAASGNYDAVTASRTISLTKASPSVEVSGIPTSITYHGSGFFTLSSLSQARYSISGNAKCSIQMGSTIFNNVSNKYDTTVNVYGIDVGSCSITYSQASDGVNYSGFNGTAFNIDINAAQLTPALTASMGETSISYGNNVTLDFSGGNSSRVTYTTTAGCNLSTSSANTTSGASSVIVSVANASSGSCTVTASQVADSHYSSTSAQLSLTLVKANPTITAASVPASIPYLASVDNVKFTSNSTEGGLNISGSGSCSVSNVVNTAPGIVTATVGSNAPSGNCSLIISQAASNNYNSTSVTNTSITLTKANPAVSFTMSDGSNPLPYNTQATLSLVTPSSGLVTFVNNNSNNCSIVSTSPQSSSNGSYTTSIVVKSLVGTPVSGSGCDFTANIAADSNYNSTTDNLVVPTTKANTSIASIVWSSSSNSVSSLAYNQVATVTITSPCSGAMAISSNALCSVSNVSAPQASNGNYVVTANVKSLGSSGFCNLAISQLADSKYSQYTTSALMPLTTALPNLVITSPGSSVQYQQAGLNITSTSLSDGAVTYSITEGQSNCSISNGVLIVSGASGSSCTLQAAQEASGNYSSQTVSQVINISRSSNPPTLDLSDATKNSLSAIQYNQTVVLSAVNATSGSTLTYSLSSDTSPSVCVLVTSGSTTSLKANSGTGSCSVRVLESATSYYDSSTSAYYTFNVNKAPQAALSFGLPGGASSIAYNQKLQLSSIGGSGTGAVTYSVTSGSQYCSIVNESGALKLKGLAGTNNQALCSVVATRDADANYSVVNSAVSSFTVTPINETSPLVIALQYNNLYVGNSSGFNVTGGSGSGAISVRTSSNCHYNVNNDHSSSGYMYTVIADSAGECVITATRDADGNYNSETDSVTLQVSRVAYAAKVVRAFHARNISVIRH